ncbi:MAG: FixH family protein [Phycisphaerales bacterium]
MNRAVTMQAGARVRGVWRVPAVVALVFIAGLSGVGALIVRATGDATFGIEPEYYTKGLRWDQSRRAQAASTALGWSSAVAVENGTLRVTLRDREGRPVDRAEVSAEAFAWSRSKERCHLSLVEAESGVYAAALGGDGEQTGASGWWQVRLRAVRDQQVYLSESKLEVASPGPRSVEARP